MAEQIRESTPDIDREIERSKEHTRAWQQYRDDRNEMKAKYNEFSNALLETQRSLGRELEGLQRQIKEIELKLNNASMALNTRESDQKAALQQLYQGLGIKLKAIGSPGLYPHPPTPVQDAPAQTGNQGEAERPPPAAGGEHNSPILTPRPTTQQSEHPTTTTHDASPSPTSRSGPEIVSHSGDQDYSPMMEISQGALSSDDESLEEFRSEPAGREMDFEEVFQDGKAEEKHAIVEFPKASGRWYILRCDQHNMRFGINAIKGAAKHIRGEQHGNMIGKHKTAVRLLGIRVKNCDAEKAAKNNEAFQAEHGGKAFHTPQHRGRAGPKGKHSATRRRSTNVRGGSEDSLYDSILASDPASWPWWNLSSDDSEAALTQRSAGTGLKASAFQGITNPVVGDVYQAYWPPTKEWFAAVPLPIGDLGAFGISGTIAGTGLISGIPDCYEFDKRESHIFGWKNGFKDGEARVNKRWFPCMYLEDRLPSPLDEAFDFDNILRADVLAWVPAQYLRPLNAQDPTVLGTDLAEDWKERLNRRGRSTTAGNDKSSQKLTSDKDLFDFIFSESEPDNDISMTIPSGTQASSEGASSLFSVDSSGQSSCLPNSGGETESTAKSNAVPTSHQAPQGNAGIPPASGKEPNGEQNGGQRVSPVALNPGQAQAPPAKSNDAPEKSPKRFFAKRTLSGSQPPPLLLKKLKTTSPAGSPTFTPSMNGLAQQTRPPVPVGSTRLPAPAPGVRDRADLVNKAEQAASKVYQAPSGSSAGSLNTGTGGIPPPSATPGGTPVYSSQGIPSAPPSTHPPQPGPPTRQPLHEGNGVSNQTQSTAAKESAQVHTPMGLNRESAPHKVPGVPGVPVMSWRKIPAMPVSSGVTGQTSPRWTPL